MLSVTQPIERSIATVRTALFSPFKFGAWCALGFTAFLAGLLQGGGYYGGGPRGFAKAEPLGDGLARAGAWVAAHPLLVAAAAGLGVALMLLLRWLGARGQFMFLDNLARGRAEVAGPWRRFGGPALRVFGFTLLLDLASLLVVAGGLAVVWTVAQPDLADLRLDLQLLKGILAGLAVMAPFGLVLALAGLFLRDFVVPVMYLRGVGVLAGFRMARRDLAAGEWGSFVMFYLMKLVLSLAAGGAIGLVSCLTCFMAALPYVSAVVFLPVHVFFRAYSLHFMAQRGEAWRIL